MSLKSHSGTTGGQGPLSARDLELFHEQGFLLSDPIFSESQIENLKKASLELRDMARELQGMVMHRGSQFVVDQLGERTGDNVRIHRVVWCGAAIPELLLLGQVPQLVQRVAQLLESSQLVQIINQMHFKFPGDGIDFPFHQDSRHRHYGTDQWSDVSGKGSYIQTVCAIDPVTEDNGPMIVLPGSHKAGHLELDYPEQFEDKLPDGFKKEYAMTVAMKPGQVLFFGPYLIHGSKANESNEPRRIFINGFCLPGANRREYPGCGKGLNIQIAEATS